MPRWTNEARQKQREVIMKSKPWKKSTGPKTSQGKENSSLNSLKHGLRSKEGKALFRALYTQSQYVRAASSAKPPSTSAQQPIDENI